MKTFVIIKPDAFARGLVGKIITRFEDRGLCIERIERRYKSIDWCKQHYAELYRRQNAGEFDTPVAEENEIFVTGASLIGIVLGGNEAISRVRRMLGATNTLFAIPGTIRGDFGQHGGCYNLIHAADSEESVNSEINLFFDPRTDQ